MSAAPILHAHPVVRRIVVPDVPMGSKCWVPDHKGLFILAEGPGIFVNCGCTHTGSGSIIVYDGIPDERGFFPGDKMHRDEDGFYSRNGRPLFPGHPVVMGMWQANSGFIHGLTVKIEGGQDGNNPNFYITWITQKTKRSNTNG